MIERHQLDHGRVQLVGVELLGAVRSEDDAGSGTEQGEAGISLARSGGVEETQTGKTPAGALIVVNFNNRRPHGVQVQIYPPESFQTRQGGSHRER
jgi:hypothetical protein